MAFSEDELQLLIKKVEKGQAKARRRTVVAIIIPTVAATLYLGFTILLINDKKYIRSGRSGVNSKKEELREAEVALASKLSTIRESQQLIRQGNTLGAQELIVGIDADSDIPHFQLAHWIFRTKA